MERHGNAIIVVVSSNLYLSDVKGELQSRPQGIGVQIALFIIKDLAYLVSTLRYAITKQK